MAWGCFPGAQEYLAEQSENTDAKILLVKACFEVGSLCGNGKERTEKDIF